MTITAATLGGTATAPAGFTFLQAYLSITKTASEPRIAGDTLTFTLTVHNDGPDAATNVTVTDPLPAGTQLISATPSQGACSGETTVICTLGTLGDGASATVNILVRTSLDATTITNTATVTAADGDPTPANNAGSAEAALAIATGAPSLSESMLIALALLLASAAVVKLR